MSRAPAGAPSSSYRLQFSAETTFADGLTLLPYLDGLGVGALYASPLLEAGVGSNHGYDVVDPTRVSGERGGEQARRELIAAVHERGLKFVLDIVPNHVGVAGAKANPWWWDVLRLGRESEFAGYFDIDWGGDARGRSCCRSWLMTSTMATRRRPSPSSGCPRTAPSCATTSTPSRWPPAPGPTAARRRCTSVSTTGWSRGAAARPS